MKYWYEDYNQFLTFFKKSGTAVDETVFYFKSDKNEEEHYIGFIPQYDEPYWAGYCDIPDGCSFMTAEELFNAKIYDGKSIKDRWNEIVIHQIGCISAESWSEINN